MQSGTGKPKWRLEGVVLVVNRLHAVEASLAADGKIDILNTSMLSAPLALREEAFEGRYRFLQG